MPVEPPQSTLTSSTPIPAERLLDVKELKKYFPIRKGFFKSVVGQVRSIDGVTFHLNQGETLGLVGESGCGKSVTVSSILKLHDPDSSIIEGDISYHQDNKGIRQINEMHSKSKAMQEIRGNQISMIFQEPMTALSPVHTVGDQICEMMILHKKLSLREASERTIALLEKVGIPSPRKRFNLYPFQDLIFSLFNTII